MTDRKEFKCHVCGNTFNDDFKWEYDPKGLVRCEGCVTVVERVGIKVLHKYTLNWFSMFIFANRIRLDKEFTKGKEFVCQVCKNRYDVSMASDDTYTKCDGCDPSKLIEAGKRSFMEDLARKLVEDVQKTMKSKEGK